MKIAQLPTVRIAALIRASPQWNSSPAIAEVTTRMGREMTMPSLGRSRPNSAMEPTMMASGFQAMSPMGSPPSVSMVRDSNSVRAPRMARRMPRPKGKYPGPGRADEPNE